MAVAAEAVDLVDTLQVVWIQIKVMPMAALEAGVDGVEPLLRPRLPELGQLLEPRKTGRNPEIPELRVLLQQSVWVERQKRLLRPLLL